MSDQHDIKPVFPAPLAPIMTISLEGVVSFNSDLTPEEGSEQAWALLLKMTEQRNCGVAALQAENARLKEYAIEASKALTGLTVGGSEFFAGQKLGFFKADIPACVKHIRWRFDNARKMGEAKGLSSQHSEADRMRAGLQRIALPIAFYVGTGKVDPEAFARMIYAEKVLAGMDLELADKETEAATKDRYPLRPVKTQET